MPARGFRLYSLYIDGFLDGAGIGEPCWYGDRYKQESKRNLNKVKNRLESRMSWLQNLAGIKNEMESKMSQNQKWSGNENELESKIESKIESKRKEDWIYLKC